jgi:hypothetical protein
LTIPVGLHNDIAKQNLQQLRINNRSVLAEQADDLCANKDRGVPSQGRSENFKHDVASFLKK